MVYNVVVFSDEPLVLHGLQSLAAQVDDLAFSCISELQSLTEYVSGSQSQAVVLDHSPDLDLRIVRDLRAAAPGCHVILWTRHIEAEIAWQAVEAGVRGIVKKTAATSALLDCVRGVCAGEMWLERSLTAALLTMRPVKLTKRESQLVLLLAQGLKNKEIATSLNISEGTVKVYISRLFEKVGAKDRLELALYAVRNMGWITSAMRPVEAPPASMLRSVVLRVHA